LSPPFFLHWCRLSFGRHCHAVAPYHASFPLSQDKLAGSTSSFDNVSSIRLPSRVETGALNPHHHSKSPSPDRLTPTLHYYKKIISILLTLTTTQSRLYFVSSLARAPRHWSFTHRHSLSPLFHTYHPFVQ
jgi:hypothetical protein